MKKQIIFMISMLFCFEMHAQVTPSGTPVNTVTITTTGTSKNAVTKQESTATKNQLVTTVTQSGGTATSTVSTTTGQPIVGATTVTATKSGQTTVAPGEVRIDAENFATNKLTKINAFTDSIELRSDNELTGDYSRLVLKPLSVEQVIINSSNIAIDQMSATEGLKKIKAGTYESGIGIGSSYLNFFSSDSFGGGSSSLNVDPLQIVSSISNGDNGAEFGITPTGINGSVSDGTKVGQNTVQPGYINMGVTEGGGGLSAKFSLDPTVSDEGTILSVIDGVGGISSTAWTPETFINTSKYIKSQATAPDGITYSKIALDPDGYDEGNVWESTNGTETTTLKVNPAIVDIASKGFQSAIQNGDNSDVFYQTPTESKLKLENTATSQLSEVVMAPTFLNLHVQNSISSTSISADASDVSVQAETVYLFGGTSGIEIGAIGVSTTADAVSLTGNNEVLITSPNTTVDGNLSPRNIVVNSGTTSRPPFRYSTGTLTSTIINGAKEFDASNEYLSAGGVRYTLAKTLTATTTLDFPITANGTASDLTFTLTGAVSGDVITIGVPSASMPANGIFTAWVSATNTVTVRFANPDLINSYNPASGAFNFSLIKL